MCGLTASERSAGWRLGIVAQVGTAIEDEAVPLSETVCRLLGANLLAFRSERIQPGVNSRGEAPEQYQERQDMDVSEELTVAAGRAAYNAFAHWTGVDRERSKDLMMLERVDVLTPGGKERLREIRRGLGYVTDRVVANIPKWVDWPTGKAFSRNAMRGKKACIGRAANLYRRFVTRRNSAGRGGLEPLGTGCRSIVCEGRFVCRADGRLRLTRRL